MDRSTIDQFVQKHKEYIYSVALAQTRDPDLAGDIAQESILKVLRAAQQLRDPERIKPWLSSIVLNTAIDWLRGEKRTPNTGLDLKGHPTPEMEPKPSMDKIVGQLRSDYRQILLLRYVEGLSYSEIGCLLDMTPTAVGEKLWRIRRFLRLRLRRPEAAIA